MGTYEVLNGFWYIVYYLGKVIIHGRAESDFFISTNRPYLVTDDEQEYRDLLDTLEIDDLAL